MNDQTSKWLADCSHCCVSNLNTAALRAANLNISSRFASHEAPQNNKNPTDSLNRCNETDDEYGEVFSRQSLLARHRLPKENHHRPREAATQIYTIESMKEAS